jgi:3-phenylpropionate/trans-cinnamate dioxygenase ferredoxin reductase subunit
VERIEGDGRARRVITQEGHILPCDFVVIGVGVRPETALAEEAGLEVDNGIVVNEFLESSVEGSSQLGIVPVSIVPSSEPICALNTGT